MTKYLTEIFVEEIVKEKFICAMRLFSVGSVDWCKTKLLEIRRMRLATHFYKCI